jgi:hypothetical protein
VVVLLGNHEVMNLMGDLRYVTPEIYASFAGPQSDSRRESAYEAYLTLIAGQSETARRRGIDAPQPDAREAWMAEHPIDATFDRHGHLAHTQQTAQFVGGDVVAVAVLEVQLGRAAGRVEHEHRDIHVLDLRVVGDLSL